MYVFDVYYFRKLVIYNFIGYDMIFKFVICNIWNEIDVKRGSCEIVI